jgi:tetratricopeptide (TPR) repeat protein
MSALNFFLSLSLLLFVGCASRESGWNKKTDTVALSSQEQKALRSQAMNLWKQRVQQENLEEALSKFEMIHASNPNDLETLIYLTRGYYFLADSHYENMDQKKKTYEKAASFGEKAMATNPAFKEKVSKGKSIEESLDTLTKQEVPAIYWTAASLGKWAKASGIAAALKYKTRIKAMIEQVEKLDPVYFYGAAPRYWGGFFAVAPSFAGGDMNKSKANFEKSLKIAPEYLGTKVLMAEVYYTKMGDKVRFKQELESVLASNQDKHPELGPENALEKRKAQKLLKNIEELF